MTNQEYLSWLLREQDLSGAERQQLQLLRTQIEAHLSVLQGQPRFYYAGSYGKKTLIREHHDLDIVMYWPAASNYGLREIYESVGKRLATRWHIERKTVAWRISFQGGLHVDVVPGRALDGSFIYANLFRSDTGTSLQTSIKVHIDHVRNSGRREAIRLLKLWKHRRAVPIPSFVLEVMAIKGMASTPQSDLEPQLLAALSYIRDRISSATVIDPANSNNDVANGVSAADRGAIASAARDAFAAPTWTYVFRL